MRVKYKVISRVKYKVISLSIVLVLILGLSFSALAANYTMSWDFQILNNPNARQVALNIAQAQKALKEDDDMLKEFEDSLHRQLLSRIMKEVVDRAFVGGDYNDIVDYPVGDYLIDVVDGGDTIFVIFRDSVTGEEKTRIEVKKNDWGTPVDIPTAW